MAFDCSRHAITAVELRISGDFLHFYLMNGGCFFEDAFEHDALHQRQFCTRGKEMIAIDPINVGESRLEEIAFG